MQINICFTFIIYTNIVAFQRPKKNSYSLHLHSLEVRKKIKRQKQKKNQQKFPDADIFTQLQKKLPLLTNLVLLTK